jgi:hypothetical protein
VRSTRIQCLTRRGAGTSEDLLRFSPELPD